jgi:hypothetical protein
MLLTKLRSSADFILQWLDLHFAALCHAMLQNRHGGRAEIEQSAWGPQSEKHIPLGSNSDAISEIFPALLRGF